MDGMSLTVETEKSLSSQEPDSQHSLGPSAENLQGEKHSVTSDEVKILQINMSQLITV